MRASNGDEPAAIELDTLDRGIIEALRKDGRVE